MRKTRRHHRNASPESSRAVKIIFTCIRDANHSIAACCAGAAGRRAPTSRGNFQVKTSCFSFDFFAVVSLDVWLHVYQIFAARHDRVVLAELEMQIYA